jgi:hypothetical protein
MTSRGEAMELTTTADPIAGTSSAAATSNGPKDVGTIGMDRGQSREASVAMTTTRSAAIAIELISVLERKCFQLARVIVRSRC